MRKRHKTRRLTGANPVGDYIPKIGLRSIDGHLVRTATTVYAWYRLMPQRWSFRSDTQRQMLIEAVAGQYAELVGRWLHIRVTSRPYPVQEWAAAHVRNAPDRLPDSEGALSWDDYIVGEQRQLGHRHMTEKEVYLGVEVQTRKLVDRAAAAAAPLLRKVFPDAVDAELVALDAEIEHLDQVMAAPGLRAKPVTAEEMRWLMHRSCTLGLPAPSSLPGVGEGRWAAEDLAAFTDAADMWHEPYAPTVTVRARNGANAGLQRNVAVLTLGLMQPLQIPESEDPWMQRVDRLGTAIEWSARIFVRPLEQVQGELQKLTGKVKSQVKHYTAEHDQDAPPSLERQADRALDIQDEMASGWSELNTRVKGWWRVAVFGADERDAIRRAQEVVDLYKPKVAIEHPEAQYHLAREFIPGEPLASQAYMRRGSVTWAAAAVPAATADVGDRRGILLGETATATRQPVAWDPWMSQEFRNSSGLTAMVAGLGGGKSFLGGGIVYKTLRAGAHWTLLDPSGPLAALCDLPDLKPYARTINLMNAEPGILNPYRVVVEPRIEDYLDEPDGEAAYRKDLTQAAASRRRLVQDVLLGLLPYNVGRMPESQIVVLSAVRAVGGHHASHPGMVIDQLRRDQTEHRAHARVVADFLDEVRERMTLLIPENPEDDPYSRHRDDRLTVFTMAGLVLPKDGVPREHWTDSESLGVQLLNLAAWLTQRAVYEGPAGAARSHDWKNARKGVWIDEAFFLSEVPTGRTLMNRFARDSRKWNVRVLLSSQLPADFLRIQGFASLVDSVFVGRLDDAEAQADALRLLKVPVDVGYEDTIAELGHTFGGDNTLDPVRDRAPRRFVFADGAGGIERIVIDFSGPHLAPLRKALDTTPGQRRTLAPAAEPAQLPSASRPPHVDGGTVTVQSAPAPHPATAAESLDLELSSGAPSNGVLSRPNGGLR